MRTLATWGLGVLLFSCCLAQDKGQVRLFIDPGHNFEYVLDGERRMKEKVVELTTGPHSFSFWAPTRAIVDTTINIEQGEQPFYLRLPFSLSYMAHEREMQKFKKKLFIKRSLPALLTLGAGIWSGVSFGNYSKANSDLNDLYDEYDVATVPNAITVLKTEDIPSAKDDFKDAESQFIISTSVFAAGLLYTVYMFRKTKGMQPPVFEDKAKVKFDGLVYVPGNSGGTLHTGLTLSW